MKIDAHFFTAVLLRKSSGFKSISNSGIVEEIELKGKNI